MALSNVAAALTEPDGLPWRTCATCHHLEQMSDEDAAVLRGLLSDRNVKFSELEKALREDPDSPTIARDSLSRHARGICGGTRGTAMKRAAAVAILAAVTLTGCGPDRDNTDPREGVVYLEWRNCLTDACFNVSKVCLGPDLIWRDTRLSEENRETVIENAPECER